MHTILHFLRFPYELFFKKTVQVPVSLLDDTKTLKQLPIRKFIKVFSKQELHIPLMADDKMNWRGDDFLCTPGCMNVIKARPCPNKPLLHGKSVRKLLAVSNILLLLRLRLNKIRDKATNQRSTKGKDARKIRVHVLSFGRRDTRLRRHDKANSL